MKDHVNTFPRIKVVMGLAVLIAAAGCTPEPTPTAIPTASTDTAMQKKPLSPSDVLTAQRKIEIVKRIADTGKGVTVGDQAAPRVAYVFFDPKCSHCGDLWNAAAPLTNQVRFVWIPVALLGEKSGKIGATILGASDPAGALEKNEASARVNGDGIAVSPEQVKIYGEAVTSNTTLLETLVPEFPISSVPFTVYQDENGLVEMLPGSMSTSVLAAQMRLK